MTKPLEGIRILDLTRFIAGPYATMMLGDFGADVVKIEHPTVGDATRRWGTGENAANNPYYMSVNRSKRSIAIDLKTPEGKQLLTELLAQSDVVMQNGLYGAFDKLGFTHERLAEINPRLIRCDVTGFGDRGPERDEPALDFVIQARAGVMNITGEPEGAPMKVGFPVIDVLTALTACNGILAAVCHRERTGEVQHVSTSMIETALASMPNIVSDYIVENIPADRWGNAHPNLAPYEAYQAKDGWFALSVATEPQWQRLIELIGRADMGSDPRFLSNIERMDHRAPLNDILKPLFRNRTLDDWMADFIRLGIPCSRVGGVADVLASPQVRALKVVEDVTHPVYGTVPMVRSPLKFDGEVLEITRHPPLLSEHADEILAEILGYDGGKIEQLRGQGVIR